MWITLVIIAMVLGIWGAAVYNRLRTLSNRIDNAWAQIDVQLKRRYDLIPNLVEVARGYMQHEASTLEGVTLARTRAVDAANAIGWGKGGRQMTNLVGSLESAEQLLGSSLGRLMVVAEAYPELKADVQMQRLSEEIASTENRIGFARQAYNDEVLAFNDKASQFPDLICARVMGFTYKPMLRATSSEQERITPAVRF